MQFCAEHTIDAVRAVTSPRLAMAPRRRFAPPPPNAAADPHPGAAPHRLHRGLAPPPGRALPWPLAAGPRRALRGAPGAAPAGGRCGGNATHVLPQRRAHLAGGAGGRAPRRGERPVPVVHARRRRQPRRHPPRLRGPRSLIYAGSRTWRRH